MVCKQGQRPTSLVPERPETGDEDEEALQRLRVADLAENADHQQREGAEGGRGEDDEPAAESVGCQDETRRGHEGEDGCRDVSRQEVWLRTALLDLDVVVGHGPVDAAEGGFAFLV